MIISSVRQPTRTGEPSAGITSPVFWWIITSRPDAVSIWATPVIAGKRLYSFTQDGNCFTVELGGAEGKIVATSKLGESVLGSPSIADNAMFVRSVDALWKIAVN